MLMPYSCFAAICPPFQVQDLITPAPARFNLDSVLMTEIEPSSSFNETLVPAPGLTLPAVANAQYGNRNMLSPS